MQPWSVPSTPSTLLKRLEGLEARRATVSRTHTAPSAAVPRGPVSAADLMRRIGLEPDAWQQQIFTSQARQLLLLAHRQAGKSTCIAALALETACNTAGALILLLSRTLRQSSELFRKVHSFYLATQPQPLLRRSALSLELVNGSRIISLPGTEETIVGYSAPNVIVIDEAARVLDGLYYAIRPMLAMSQGRLIALTTPWGKRGWFYEGWEGTGESEVQTLDAMTVNALLADLGIRVAGEPPPAEQLRFAWERVRLTAPQNPRLSPWFLANERRTVPDLVFRSEWLCEFVESQDDVFRYDDLAAMLSPQIAPLWGEEIELPWVQAGALPLVEEEDSEVGW